MNLRRLTSEELHRRAEQRNQEGMEQMLVATIAISGPTIVLNILRQLLGTLIASSALPDSEAQQIASFLTEKHKTKHLTKPQIQNEIELIKPSGPAGPLIQECLINTTFADKAARDPSRFVKWAFDAFASYVGARMTLLDARLHPLEWNKEQAELERISGPNRSVTREEKDRVYRHSAIRAHDNMAVQEERWASWQHIGEAFKQANALD